MLISWKHEKISPPHGNTLTPQNYDNLIEQTKIDDNIERSKGLKIVQDSS